MRDRVEGIEREGGRERKVVHSGSSHVFGWVVSVACSQYIYNMHVCFLARASERTREKQSTRARERAQERECARKREREKQKETDRKRHPTIPRKTERERERERARERERERDRERL